MKSKSPLHNLHIERQASFADFADSTIVEAFGDVGGEYTALRERAAISDFCHRGRIRIEADNLTEFLNEILTIDVRQLDRGSYEPTFVCNDRGGIVDKVDLFLDENWCLLLGSTRARPDLLRWLQDRAAEEPTWGARIIDVTDQQGAIAVRGPDSPEFVKRLAIGQNIRLEENRGVTATMGTIRTLILRRGDDVTDGYDFVAGSVFLQNLWERMLLSGESMGVIPIGHKARETLRIESGIPQVGTELDPDTTPLEIDMHKLVDFRKTRFRGKRALMHSNSSEFTRRLVCLHTDTELEVQPNSELLFDNLPIGRITSIARIPGKKGQRGLGFVNSLKSSPGTIVTIRSRMNLSHSAEIVRPTY